MSRTERFVVDRIEDGGIAVLISDDGMIRNVSVSDLGFQPGEGSVLLLHTDESGKLRIETDEDETKIRAARLKARLHRIARKNGKQNR